MMNEFETVIDFGSKNLRLSVFNNSSELVFSRVKHQEKSEHENSKISLIKIIRDAEKKLSMHIDRVNVLYDSVSYKFVDLAIKKTFDRPTLISKYYYNLIEEANFIVKENYFKDQIVHSIINKIIIDNSKNLEVISDQIKVNSFILEIKFICIKRSIINDLKNEFKRNNLIISNIFCSSYVKSLFYKNKLEVDNNFIFLDIGYERSSAWYFKNNKLKFFNSINIGGNSITKDISKVLKLNINYSEELKINFNQNENKNFYQNSINHFNLYTEIQEKNISIGILKKIIQARVDEIIEIIINQNDYFKKKNVLKKPNIIFIGSGSKLLSNSLNLDTSLLFSKSIFFKETDSMICEAGYNYSKSSESRLIQSKDKLKRSGFFESFFNFFSN